MQWLYFMQCFKFMQGLNVVIDWFSDLKLVLEGLLLSFLPYNFQALSFTYDDLDFSW